MAPGRSDTLAAAPERPLIGVTVGDPAGIGPEITVKALRNPEVQRSVRAVAIADRAVLERTLDALGLDVELHAVIDPEEGGYTAGVIDFVDAGVLRQLPAYGEVSAAAGAAGLAYLERGIASALKGELVGLATAPLNKESLQAAKAPFIDHTAVLKTRAAHRQPMTLFVAKTLRIFFLTRHISFREIADAITAEGILEALPMCDLYLRQLGLKEPMLAVAALNPHGGEQGLFGTDEMQVIGPALAEAQRRGWRVTGLQPVPGGSLRRCALPLSRPGTHRRQDPGLPRHRQSDHGTEVPPHFRRSRNRLRHRRQGDRRRARHGGGTAIGRRVRGGGAGAGGSTA